MGGFDIYDELSTDRLRVNVSSSNEKPTQHVECNIFELLFEMCVCDVLMARLMVMQIQTLHRCLYADVYEFKWGLNMCYEFTRVLHIFFIHVTALMFLHEINNYGMKKAF